MSAVEGCPLSGVPLYIAQVYDIVFNNFVVPCSCTDVCSYLSFKGHGRSVHGNMQVGKQPKEFLSRLLVRLDRIS